MSFYRLAVLCCVMVSFIFSQLVSAQTQSHLDEERVKSFTRIITLSPHLTEWVYALQSEDRLVGVSAYSDYPADAIHKPVVADANGVNFKSLISLNPDLILVWEGGNKSQDIARLTSLGLTLFHSSPTEIDDISSEIYTLGKLLNRKNQAKRIQQTFNNELHTLRAQYQTKQKLPIFFYMWSKPMMSIGKNAWANKALSVCNAQTIFVDSPSDYPEVRIAEVLIRKPHAMITTINGTRSELEAFWVPHREVLKAPIFQVDGAIINRFTPRITKEIATLCASLRSS